MPAGNSLTILDSILVLKFQMLDLQLQQQSHPASLNRPFQPSLWMVIFLCKTSHHFSSLATPSLIFGAEHKSCETHFLLSKIFFPDILITLSWSSPIPFMRLFLSQGRCLYLGSQPCWHPNNEQTRLSKVLAILLVNCSHWCYLTLHLSSWPMSSPCGNDTGTLWARISYIPSFPVFLTVHPQDVLYNKR